MGDASTFVIDELYEDIFRLATKVLPDRSRPAPRRVPSRSEESTANSLREAGRAGDISY
jgi:hypothetical protein